MINRGNYGGGQLECGENRCQCNIRERTLTKLQEKDDDFVTSQGQWLLRRRP